MIQFKQEGYTIVKKAIPHKDLDIAYRSIQKIFEDQLLHKGMQISNSTIDNFENIYRLSTDLFIACCRISQASVAVNALSFNKSIIDAIAEVGLKNPCFNTNPVTHIISDRLVIPGGYQRAPVHQDWRFMQGSLNSIVVWIPYQDIDDDSLPMEVIPGSHKTGLLPSIKIKHEYGVDPNHFDESQFIPIKVQKGDAVIFSTFLVHRTATSPFSGFRISSSFRYDDAGETSYINRGYPNPFKRQLDREMIEKEGFYPTL